MTTRKRTPGGVPATTLAGNINAGVTSLVIADATNWSSTFPFDIIVNKASSTLRERITVGGRTGTTLNTLTRGIDGTTAQSHSLGDTVEVCVAGQYLDDLGQFLSVTTAGDMLYFDGTNWQRLAAGALDQFVKQSTGPAAPAWSHKGIVPVYADSTARDAAIPSPPAGQGAYLHTGASTEGLSFYNGTNWRLPWNMPWGNVARATSNAATSGITTDADVTTATFTAVSNRRYRIYGFCLLQQITSGGVASVKITDNTPTQLQVDSATLVVNGFFVGKPIVEVTPSAGSVTYRLRVNTNAGTATLQGTGTTQVHYLTIDDIGPSGAPT